MKEINEIIIKLKQKQPLLEKDYLFLLKYLQHDDNETNFKQVLSTHWDEVCDDNDLILKEPDDLFYKINYKAQEVDKQKQIRKIGFGIWVQRIAAILLLPLLIISMLQYYSNVNNASLLADTLHIQSPYNSKTRFFLPDGTKGWLQANANIHFSYNEKGQREVILDGKAFFNVAKNENKPFIVCVNDFKVKVHGTRFNVSSDNYSPYSQVYLEEGSVEMLSLDDKYQTMLQPGEEFFFDKSKQQFTVKKGIREDHLAWTEGVLLLKNKPLKDAIRELEQFYYVDIELEDKELENLTLYARIQNERLEDVLEYTKLILPINYKIENPKLINDGNIYKRKVVITKN